MAIHVDNICEKNHIYLTNLQGTAYTAADTWYNPTAAGTYACVSYNYKVPLSLGHYYFGTVDYKYTTTDKSPTQVTLYFQGGGNAFGDATVVNPVVNTAYTISGFGTPAYHAGRPSTSSSLYQGPSNAISGALAHIRNLAFYDVTELYALLRSKGIVTSDATMRTWCRNNLTYHAPDEVYDVTSLVEDTSTKLTFHEGEAVVNEVVECDGMNAYSVSTALASNCYFDTGSAISIYNNAGGGTVTHTRVSASAQDSPFAGKHPYVLKITTNGSAAPNAGGFIATHTAAANKIFVEKFVAKVPVGYTINAAYNSQGTGSSVVFNGNNVGTGKWEEYTIVYKCGSSGTFSSGGHVYLKAQSSSYSETSVTWYLAYVNNCEITGKEYLKNYAVLPNVWKVKDGILFVDELDNVNLFANGNFSKQETQMLPSGWTYDATDKAGNGYASVVQPVGATYGQFGPWPIDPTKQYKVSFWVKCKQDMSSFLTGVVYQNASKGELGHSAVHYVAGTKTTLAAALNNGATTVSLTSGANWVVKNYSRLGFRKSSWSSSYNDDGTSNTVSSTGLIQSVSGNTLTLAAAYSGANKPAGTVVVESYDGGTYPYPVNKSMLPTDNTWKYVEGYFGGTNNASWDGATASNGASWAAIPAEAAYVSLRLNLYTNNGSVPIKYSDIRIEPVSQSFNRAEKKIQINEVN